METQNPNRNHIWVMLALGFVIRLIVYFNASYTGSGSFQAWAMVCDLAIGYLIYRLVHKSDFVAEASKEGRRPLILVALWVFNPAVIYASSVLGMTEPLFALLMVLILLQLRGKAYSAALVLILPVIFQVRHWLTAYDPMSASGFNFFALMGGINLPPDTSILGFNASVWGAVLALTIVSGAAFALYTDCQTGSRNYFLIIGAYFILLFTFSTGMQERNLFPGLVFLFIYYVERRDTRVIGLYLAFSVTFLINASQILRLSRDAHHIWAISDSVVFASAANVLLALVLLWVLVNAVWPGFKWLAPPGEAAGRQGIPVKYYIWLLLAGGFIVRVLAAMHVHAPDAGVLMEQAVRLFEYGLPRFYGSMYQTIAEYSVWSGTSYTFTISQTDYPPVFFYVLYVVGALRHIFGWDIHGMAFQFAVFLPGILCDLAIGYVLYRRAEKSRQENSRARLPALLAAFWILNPAVILISGAWGPVEPVYVLMLLLSLLLLRDRKLLPAHSTFAAYLLFGIAVLTRPQALFLTPVYIYSTVRYLQEEKFSAAGFKRLAVYTGAVVAVMVLIALPFNLSAAARHTWAGAMQRPYGTYNAFNFFALAGGNMRPLSTRFMGLTYGFISFIVIIAVIAGLVVALDKNRKQSHYFLIVGALFVLLFVFAFRMQAMYLFPALPFLLLYAIESRDRRVLGLYAGFSATLFINCFESLHTVLRLGMVRDDVLRAVSFGNVLLACVLLFVVTTAVLGESHEQPVEENQEISHRDTESTESTEDTVV